MNRRDELHLLKRWRCSFVYYCGSFVFLLILLKRVLKQETIALDVKVKVSMKCENIDTEEPLTHVNPPAPQFKMNQMSLFHKMIRETLLFFL